MEYSWAADYPDVLKTCQCYNLVEISEPKRVCYKPFKGVTQEGPQCGLVALAICMESPTRETIDKLLQESLEAGFTYNGEMFSADQMMELTKQNLPNKVSLHEGILDTNEITSFLLSGGLMLVPYDCDRNHTPSKWRGHKAHWTLITGIVEGQDGLVYVIARHGKSNNVAIWSLGDLSESNAQLDEFSPDRKLQDVEYKLPEGGISGANGLKLKAVCIWPESKKCS